MASPELASILEMLRSARQTEGTELDVGRVRTMMEMMTAPPPARVRAHRVEVAGRRAEWLVPEGADEGRRILYLHGGAYVAGSEGTHRAMAGRIARAAGCAALTIDYRLAPEHRFPAALDDATAAYRFVAEHGPSGPGAPKRLFLAGDSAGGGLALATLLVARDTGLFAAHAAALISPWTDLAVTGGSIATNGDRDPLLPPAFIRPAAETYLDGHDPRDPRASPLYGDLSRLPPLFVQVGDTEVLLDDSRRLDERARAAGTEVTLEIWPEMIHVWHSFSPVLREGREAIDRIGAFFRARA